MINQMIEGIFEGARNDLFFKVDGNEFTLCVGIRFISGHGCSSGMDSIQMSISIMDCPCCSSVLSVQTDFFYRLNEKISRSAAIGWIELLTMSFICKVRVNKMLQEVCAILSDLYFLICLCNEIMSNQIIKPFIQVAICMKGGKFFL